jgi:iron(III) transport system permease protein
MGGSRAAGLDAGAIFGALIGAVVIILVAYPLFWLFVGPSVEKGRLDFGYLLTLVNEPGEMRALINSVIAGGGTMVVSLMAGVPLAYLVSRTDLPLAGVIRNLTVASYMTPSFLMAFAYVLLLGPNAGLINRALVSVMSLNGPPFNIFTMGGLIFVATLEAIPLVFLATTTAMESMDGNLENAARILGAGPGRMAATITLPIILPATAAGGLLAFISTLSLYGAPAILGVKVIPTEIRGLLGFPPNFDQAAALSLYLMTLSLLGFFAYWRLLKGRMQYVTVTGKWAPAERILLRGWKIPALIFCFLYLMLAIALPYLMLGFASLTRAVGTGLRPENLTFDHYRYILGDPFSLRALRNSFVLGIAAAVVGTLLGLVVAYIEVREGHARGANLLQYIAMLPFGVPSIVLGVGLILAFIRPPLVLYGSMWILLVAYVVKFMPLAIRTSSSSLRQIDFSLEEASRIVGGSRLRTFWTITVPLVRRGLLASAFLIFIPSFRELGASVLLSGPKTETVAFAMITSWGSVSFEVTCALAVVTLLMTVGIFFLIQGPVELLRSRG